MNLNINFFKSDRLHCKFIDNEIERFGKNNQNLPKPRVELQYTSANHNSVFRTLPY